MKMLTLTQPWATLVAIGAKRIETRSWSTEYRGPVAIHAAKGLNGLHRGPAAEQDMALWNLCGRREFFEALGVQMGETWEEIKARCLPRGCIVAVADLDLVTATPLDAETRADYSPDEWAFGDYSPGRYAWLLENVQPLPVPYEIRGERGLQTLDPRVARYITREIQEVPA